MKNIFYFFALFLPTTNVCKNIPVFLVILTFRVSVNLNCWRDAFLLIVLRVSRLSFSPSLLVLARIGVDVVASGDQLFLGLPLILTLGMSNERIFLATLVSS